MTDWFEQAGIIVFTENYDACVAFYGQTLGLEQVNQLEGLTTFAFGAAYLMIESGGVASGHEKTRAENPTIIRFNVTDVEATAEMLCGRGVAVEIRHWNWGITGKMLDPDGNRVQLKNQTNEYSSHPPETA